MGLDLSKLTLIDTHYNSETGVLGTIPANSIFRGFYIDEDDDYKLKIAVEVIVEKE